MADLKKKPTQTELAAEYGVSRQALNNWKRANVDIFNSKEVYLYCSQLQRNPLKGTALQKCLELTEGVAPLSSKETPQRTFAQDQVIDNDPDLSWHEKLKNAKTERQANFYKKMIEAHQKSFEFDVKRGLYTSNEMIEENAIRIGSAVRAMILKLENELPAILVGLNEAEMQKKINKKGCEILTQLGDVKSELYK